MEFLPECCQNQVPHTLSMDVGVCVTSEKSSALVASVTVSLLRFRSCYQKNEKCFPQNLVLKIFIVLIARNSQTMIKNKSFISELDQLVGSIEQFW